MPPDTLSQVTGPSAMRSSSQVRCPGDLLRRCDESCSHQASPACGSSQVVGPKRSQGSGVELIPFLDCSVSMLQSLLATLESLRAPLQPVAAKPAMP